MKKIKWTIMTLVVSLSVGGALATAPQGDCRTQTQYYLTGGIYMPAGTFGVNFLCDQGGNACSYITDGAGNYYACRIGNYRAIPSGINNTNKTPTAKTNKK